jgi:hypothetical protein
MKRKQVGITITLVLISLILLLSVYTPVSTRPLDSPMTPSPSPSPSPSPTLCPQATPELLAVEPVTSPTILLSQVVTVHIGNGEAVTVTAESGTFTTTGSFGAFSSPALVDVALINNITHHLSVKARVRIVNVGGCQYGGYTLSTVQDRFGAPLTIVQESKLVYLPIVLKNAAP